MVDLSVSGRPAQTRQDAIPKLPAGLLEWLVASAAMVLVLLAPALWNGFPLVFPDTGGYLGRPFEGTLALGRSALYGLFLYTSIPAAFWPNVIVQAALIAWLIVLTMRASGLGGRPWLALTIVSGLSVCTSLPWFAAQLMPDILFPCAVLALYLLSFRSAQLAGWERGALPTVIAVAIPTHMAAAGLCVGLIVTLALVPRYAPDLPRPKLLLAAIAVAAGILLCPISNVAVTGKLAFTPGGESFLFGRLIEDGIVKRYLDEHCPDPNLRLCAYRARLPDEADDWLWGDSVFYTLGGATGYAGEERAIIAATLEAYPLLHVETAFGAALRQFASFQTEISISDNEPTYFELKKFTPQLMGPLMRARQQSEHFDVTPLNLLHVPLGALAIGTLALALLARRRLAPEVAALCLTVLLALAINAAICGIFSHPVDRYQGRLVILAPFAVALLIARRKLSPGQAPCLGALTDMP